MKRYVIFLLSVTFIAFSLGCGGGGGGTTGAVVSNSPYAGGWKGSWRLPATSESGAIELSVSSSGVTTGTIYNYTLSATGGLAGTTDVNGNFSGTSTYPGLAASTISSVLNLSNGVLSGTFVQSGVAGGEIKAFAESTTNSTYAGTWAGTWTAPALAQNGNVALTISSTGAVSGTLQNLTIGKTATVSGYSDGNGNFGFPLTYPGEATSIVTGNLGVISNNQLSSVFVQTVNAVEGNGTFSIKR